MESHEPVIKDLSSAPVQSNQSFHSSGVGESELDFTCEE